MISLMVVYGPRDAASVLMYHRHRVAKVYRSREGVREWAWKLDGQLVTLRELEDQAEQYERLKYRHTERDSRARLPADYRGHC